MIAPAIVCQYCKQPAKYCASSEHIYRGADYGPVWDCRKCDAYVGCHPDGSPKGTLANYELRLARRRAHVAFDPVFMNWRPAYPDAKRLSGRMRQALRSRAYAWLAHHMQLSGDDTHIAMFDEARCDKVVALIAEKKPDAAAVREWAKAREAVAT